MTNEDSLQIACANYLRLQYPKALWCHNPNGGSRNVIEGAKLKKMGVTKGVPDILIFEKRGDYSGLSIELKYGKNKATPEQEDWLERLYYNGWRTHVIYSFDSFKSIVDEYFLEADYINHKVIHSINLN